MPNRYRPKGVFGKGVGNSKKCVRNASEINREKRNVPKCVRNTSKLRQKGVKNARNTFGGEHLLDDTDPKESQKSHQAIKTPFSQPFISWENWPFRGKGQAIFSRENDPSEGKYPWRRTHHLLVWLTGRVRGHSGPSPEQKSGEKKTNKHKQLRGIVPEMGGGQIVYVFPLFLTKKGKHIGKAEKAGIIPGQSRDNPGTIPRKFCLWVCLFINVSQKGSPERCRFRFFPFSSVFFRFFPFFSVFFRFFPFHFQKKTGRHRSRDPFCETPSLLVFALP